MTTHLSVLRVRLPHHTTRQLGVLDRLEEKYETTILDALMTILFYTVGKPCLEGGVTIGPNNVFESITIEETVIINSAEKEGQMHITRDEGNLVTFGTEREVYGALSLMMLGSEVCPSSRPHAMILVLAHRSQ